MSERNVMAALERVERAAEQAQYSRQPRFTDTDPFRIMNGIIKWVNRADEDSVPEWKPKSSQRDAWLRDFWRTEPHLAGVVSSVAFIDANRDWTLTGGRNQVLRYDRILRESEADQGWRTFMSKSALSYYATDLGNVTEIGRDGTGGPMRALFHVDSARCELSGDPDVPLRYTPHVGGKTQRWEPEDYYRVASMPTDDESYYGLGFCAVSRCHVLAQLLVAVYQHDLEKLSSRVPQGLLLLQGIMQQQWEDAAKGNQQSADEFQRRFFNNVMVLASMGMENVDAKMIPFSSLPENFDLKMATDMYMYGVALCFGYDPIEFWPVSAGQLGRGRETEIQHRKSITKGAHAFTLGVQDRIQQELPDTLMFEFEERDAEGEMKDAELHLAWANVASVMSGGAPTLTPEQAKQYLAEKGVIPAEWTEAEEDLTTTAEGVERLLSNLHIRRAVEASPYEPIIRLHGLSRKEEILWHSGREALMAQQRYWYSPSLQVVEPKRITRQDDDEVLYEDDEMDFTITAEDVARAINEAAERQGAEFGELITAEVEE